MITGIRFVGALLLALPGAALAAGELATSPLTPPIGGSLVCRIANVGTAAVEISTSIVDFSGVEVGGLDQTPVPGRNVVATSAQSPDARYCLVTVVQGPRKNLRVTLEARGSTGQLVAAVSAP